MRVRPLPRPVIGRLGQCRPVIGRELAAQGGGAKKSTISSVSVEKNVFFASVNYTQVQYYTWTLH